MTQLIPVLLLGLMAWFWWGATRAREVAISAARRACTRCGVQFLDDSVALAKTRLRRDGRGQMRVLRYYRFEFSTSGADRAGGYAVVLGQRLLDLHLDLLVDDASGRPH